MPVNILATPSNLAYFIEDSQASVLVVEQDLLEKIENMPSPDTKIVVRGEPGKGVFSLTQIIDAASPALEICQTSPMDHSYWLYTSGTTGQPKGVIHLHKDLVYSIEVYGEAIGFTCDDICYGVPEALFFLRDEHGAPTALLLRRCGCALRGSASACGCPGQP